MKVSVIIPFVSSEYLNRAVKSVESQTYRNHEILTLEDSRREGPAAMRNLGIQRSTGELILPLDSDDWIHPTFLEKTVPLMKEGVGIVSTDMQYFGDSNLIVEIFMQLAESQLRENRIPCCSLIRREALKQGGYDPTLPGWEDWELWIRILKAGWTHAILPEPLFHYYVHSGGMNTKADNNKAALKARMGEKHPEFLELRKTGLTWNGI
jgi:glycosyltransferase involved in cell wall biosynthesis